MGANLIPGVRNFSINPNFTGDQHEIDDGCITAGTHRVLRFDFLSQNVGNADFVVGRPVDRPDLFVWSAAHGHYHMKEFNQYKLYDASGNLVVPSRKPGFCLIDVEQVLSTAGLKKFVSCQADQVMGISAGWADVYGASLECQYLVIDGVPDGDYTLVATTNTGHAIPEDTFDDNTVCQGLRITGNSAQTLPNPMVLTHSAPAPRWGPTSYARNPQMADTRTFGRELCLFLLILFLAGTSAAQNCGGKERWGPKDGTDRQAPNIDLTNITPEAVTDLVTIHQPHLPGDNTTRIVPDETHVYRVQARLVKWKHEADDDDYHLVLTDDTLNYTDENAHPPVPPTGHSFIGEVPNPSCFSGRDGSFGSQTPFADGINSARQTMNQRFPNADQSGAWNDGAGAQVEITGIGFFDRPHKQTGRAPNNIEIHPILLIRFLDQPTPEPSPTPTPNPQPSPTGDQWEYQMITAANATDLLNQANTQGTQGWELAGVVVDTSRSDKYVGFLKRKKQ